MHVHKYHKYVDENSSTAIMVIKRSTGVTLEVNLRIALLADNKTCKKRDPPWF